jgi:hypothetical protein
MRNCCEGGAELSQDVLAVEAAVDSRSEKSLRESKETRKQHGGSGEGMARSDAPIPSQI